MHNKETFVLLLVESHYQGFIQDQFDYIFEKNIDTFLNVSKTNFNQP